MRETLKTLKVALRVSALLIIVCVLVSTGNAQSCTGGSLTACKAACSNTDSSCTTSAATYQAACVAAVAATLAACLYVVTTNWNNCYDDCNQAGGKVQECKEGCDQGKNAGTLGCQLAAAGGTAGCTTAYQGMLNGCASQLNSCNNSCTANCG